MTQTNTHGAWPTWVVRDVVADSDDEVYTRFSDLRPGVYLVNPIMELPYAWGPWATRADFDAWLPTSGGMGQTDITSDDLIVTIEKVPTSIITVTD